MTGIQALGAVLILLAGINWISTGILVGVALGRPRIPALVERAAVATILTAAASIAGFLGYVAIVGPALPREIGLSLLAAMALLCSVPGVLWLGLFLTGRLGSPEA